MGRERDGERTEARRTWPAKARSAGAADEERRLPRVAMTTPAELLVITEREVVLLANLATRDVSPRGAFIVTDAKLPEGAPVRLHFRLSGCDPRCRVSVRGRIARVESTGVAISFERSEEAALGLGHQAGAIGA